MPSAETVGQARLAFTLRPAGSASGEAFGAPAVELGGPVIRAIALSSAEAFGKPVIAAAGAWLAPSGIASAEAFGAAALTVVVAVAPTGIPPAEAFGEPAFDYSGTPVVVGGIPSAERFGSPRLATARIDATYAIGLPVALAAVATPTAGARVDLPVQTGALMRRERVIRLTCAETRVEVHS